MAPESPASELTRGSAAQLAWLLRLGEVSAREVADAHIACIEAVNPRLDAVVVSLFEHCI